MAKIKDIVQLKSGYANFVELKSAFEAAQENTDRMAMYRPTKAHRKALARLRRQHAEVALVAGRGDGATCRAGRSGPLRIDP